MKQRAVVILQIACILLTLHVPSNAQVLWVGGSYMEQLRRAEAALPSLAADANIQPPGSETGTALRKASSAFQKLGNWRAFVGDHDGAIAAYDFQRTRPPHLKGKAADLQAIDEAVADDAIQAIVAEARTKRVVLLNEAHNISMHRAFAQKLAAELRKIGYGYLAAETFRNDDGPVPPSTYVGLTSGFFTLDPVFAGFVNSAIADGWKLVSYEHGTQDVTGSFAERIAARETGQARNLVDRIFSKDKEARVLIFVGYGHLYKSPNGAAPVMMGEHLRRMTGLDMLHVDQTHFFAHPKREDESPLYEALLAKASGKNAPFTLRAKDGTYPILEGMGGRVDMQVVFPRYAIQFGRPEWLGTLAGRAPRDIPPGLLPKTGRRLVMAYRKSDGPDAVPADNVLVEAGKPVPKLMLPKGEFRIAVED
ncbi:hypothetical protein HHL21_16720 [Massilia sp. RP-1-19]|uniref:Uncharacterized protein n=1 Tax=Massilia polaris TaxID=2728846 RepID=A0A848HSH7_9BURK|nr:hypothetical protein [Massilia polaris]NML62691.1 hypothetical protein [Massilia polaris]